MVAASGSQPLDRAQRETRKPTDQKRNGNRQRRGKNRLSAPDSLQHDRERRDAGQVESEKQQEREDLRRPQVAVDFQGAERLEHHQQRQLLAQDPEEKRRAASPARDPASQASA